MDIHTHLFLLWEVHKCWCCSLYARSLELCLCRSPTPPKGTQVNHAGLGSHLLKGIQLLFDLKRNHLQFQ